MLGTIQLTTLISLGFFLGLKHTFDPDHIVAVSTIVSRTKNVKRSLFHGALWGMGHTITLLLVGSLILVFKIAIPQKLTLTLELLVGAVLVFLGINVLLELIKSKTHQHKHRHNKVTHSHSHSHKESTAHIHIHKSFMIGMLHGLAGSAALMLIVLASVESIAQGLFYIAAFGIGLIVGMLIVSGIISLPFILTKKFDNINLGLKIFTGIISISLGFSIIYKIMTSSNLFS